MQGFETIINSIIKLGIAMLVGFVCIKTGYITKEQNNGLSKVIVRVTLPILIITSLTSLEFDTQKLKNSIYVLLVSIVVVAFLFAVGTVTSKISKMDKSRAIMHRCMTCFGNVVFMAFPLIQALYGAEGLLYAAIYELANDTCLWTLGVYQMKSIEEKEKSFMGSIKSCKPRNDCVCCRICDDGVRTEIQRYIRGSNDRYRQYNNVFVDVLYRRYACTC